MLCYYKTEMVDFKILHETFSRFTQSIFVALSQNIPVSSHFLKNLVDAQRQRGGPFLIKIIIIIIHTHEYTGKITTGDWGKYLLAENNLHTMIPYYESGKMTSQELTSISFGEVFGCSGLLRS